MRDIPVTVRDLRKMLEGVSDDAIVVTPSYGEEDPQHQGMFPLTHLRVKSAKSGKLPSGTNIFVVEPGDCEV